MNNNSKSKEIIYRNGEFIKTTGKNTLSFVGSLGRL